MKIRVDRHIGKLMGDMTNLVIPINVCTYRKKQQSRLFQSLYIQNTVLLDDVTIILLSLACLFSNQTNWYQIERESKCLYNY